MTATEKERELRALRRELERLGREPITRMGIRQIGEINSDIAQLEAELREGEV